MIQQKLLLRIAYLTIALGIAIEISQYILLLILNNDNPLKQFIADFAGKVTWTYIVCTAIALATALTSNQVKTGLAALLSVPVGLYIAQIIHKQALSKFGLDTAIAGNFSFIPVAIKAIEYGALGMLFPYFIKQEKKFPLFILTGFLAGIIFGLCQVLYKIYSTPAQIPFIKLLPLCLNELIIPIGCSCIIYASKVLTMHLKKSD
nr:hypothetical protein [Bacteroidota bacterium]